MKGTPRFDAAAMQADMVAKGWLAADLARESGLSHMTVARFFDGHYRTARTAKKIADALGRDLRVYMKTARSLGGR